MTILVTGGTGFIGSHTVVLLLSEGHSVIIVDNLCNSSRKVLGHIEEITGKMPMFIQGDIRDEDLMTAVFDQNQIEAVIHFAGLKAVGESVEKPLAYYDNNIGGTITLLKVMKQYQCQRIVFSSSATVYGENNAVPFIETHQTSTTNPYGATKRMIEEMLFDYYNANKQSGIALLRYFNPVGAHESGLIGENPKGRPNNLFPYISKVATGELKELNVFGNDYNTVDGTGVRDYIHVMDLARGHLKALEYIQSNNSIEAINLGTGKGISVLEAVEAYKKASQKEIAIKIVERRQGDIGECYADTQKANQLLGWSAEKDIDKMCEDSWRYVCNT